MKKIVHYLICILVSCDLNAQIPSLSSDTTSQSVIFLDFDGHWVSNTAWNYDGPIYCAPSGLSSVQVTDVFNRVAEDYSPFTVNVTTDSAYFLAAPLNKRMRIILTTSFEWYGSAGGTAFIGSFAWGDDTPCFVFSQLLNFNVKNIAEAVSHEAGHTLGLYHQSSYGTDCIKISDYQYGAGSGETGWAPIMGVGYYRNLTIWHNGPTPYGCNNIQNDMEVIARPINGISLRSDDAGNTPQNAQVLNLSNNQFIKNGRFNFTNDEDLYKLNLINTCMIRISSLPKNVGAPNIAANSDILTQLLDENLVIIKSSNPSDSLQSSIDTIISSGTYYIRTKPIGNVNVGTYGMLGNYTLSSSAVPVGVLPLRKLALYGININDRHKITWAIDADEQITDLKLEYAVRNQGFFRLLTDLKGATGTYTFTPPEIGPVTYRIRVTFNNNNTYYSNLIMLKTNYTKTPELSANLISNGIISIKGASNEQYQIINTQGVLLKSGIMTSGFFDIEATGLHSGMYFIRFMKDGEIIKTKKIIIL